MDRYEALKHAVKAHGDTLDKGGLLYVLHPMAVADRVESHWGALPNLGRFGIIMGGSSVESGIIVALLHDVWEDTNYGELSGLNYAQRRALARITHQPGDTYAEYIAKIAGDRLATIVKLADLSHNLSPERQSALPIETQRSLESRYFKARQVLWDVLGVEWWPT